MAKAKGDLRQIEMYAQVGLTGTGNEFRRAYDPLKSNQIVEVGMKIPIVDWGKRRGKVKVAQSNLRLTESRLRMETQEFNQNLFILVERFNNQQQQLDLAARADTIAVKRYDTNVETFLVGKISTLDLNDSQSAKDEARRNLLNALFCTGSTITASAVSPSGTTPAAAASTPISIRFSVTEKFTKFAT